MTAFAGFSRNTIDDVLVNPQATADGSVHDAYRSLRANDPVHWCTPAGFRPFWAITRHADIHAVSKANDRFVNRHRTYLAPIEAEEWTLATVGDTHLFRTLVDLDGSEHLKLRKLTNSWFLPPNLKRLEGEIAALAKAAVDGMAQRDACDFVEDVALLYPLRVIMRVLGLPPEDEPRMLKMTQEMFGPQDPDVVARSARLLAGAGAGAVAGSGDPHVDLFALAQEYFSYFGAVTAARRTNPQDDVSSVIANGLIDGAPIGEREAMSYYVIIATAGHDTTNSTAAAGMLELIRAPGERAKLRADPGLLPGAVEEMIRWATPVKHFMRTATVDTEVGGKTIRAGDALCLFYASGNRDEAVFDDPDAFRVDRTPNPQIAFGHGVHQCLGLHLARLEIRALFAELLPRLGEVELAGEPRSTIANFVSGLKTLPIRYRLD